MKHRPTKGSSSPNQGKAQRALPAEVVDTTPPVTEEPGSVDFVEYVASAYHVPRNLMLFMTRSPWVDEDENTAALHSLIEDQPKSVTGLVTGWHLKPSVGADKSLQLVNPTEEVVFTYNEKYGRSIEAQIGAWMRRYVETKRATEILFVEPDATYTKVVCVWQGLLYPVASGNAEHGFSHDRQQDGLVHLEVVLNGTFTYNEPNDLVRAQKLFDDMQASTKEAARRNALAAAAN